MTQAFLASGMMIVSGAVHAVVNAIFKSGGDKMSSRAVIDGASALIVLPAAFLLPPPGPVWVWLAASGVTHLVYLVALIKAFEGADMMVAYPVLRGIAPALTAIVSVVVFGETVSMPVALGVGLVSTGVLATAGGRHMPRRALAWSCLTGVAIALYTVIDAHGVRAADSAASYIVWTFLILGLGVGGLFAIWRGPVFLAAARSQWRAGLTAGALSIMTYGLALWALRLGATPRLAALRETSILFGIAIAAVFLKERVSPGRVAGAGLILAGAVTLLTFG